VADSRESRTPSRVAPGKPSAPEQSAPNGLASRLREHYRNNDAIWLLYHLLERSANRASLFFRHRASAREVAHGLPGTNTREANRLVWNTYDWSAEGEEWSVSSEWRQALIDEVMISNLPTNAVALEIGPGAGRWSVALQQACRELILADVSERAIELCREKLAGCDNVAYHVTDGASLSSVADSSVSFVWSFDVFVHIAPADQESYLKELARVMRPGARGVVHHAGRGYVHPGSWRSGMTAELFGDLVRARGMRMVDQFDRWGPARQHAVPTPGDVITIFER